ncbi:MAG TPA: hypothetical protein VFM27_01600, partial [Acidimicrobiales bacterium]|nr:hypothetical protein [Acidimicrobiales bacterium]
SIRTLLSTWQAEGKIWVVGDLSRHTVHAPITFRADHTAVVPGCDVTNDAFVDVGSTEIAFPEPTTSESTTTMVQHDGVWVVQDSQHVRDWQGVSDCTG